MIRTRRIATAAVTLAAPGLALTALTAPAAEAAKSGSCAGFSVTTGGRTYAGEVRQTLAPSAVGSTIEVRGRYVRFTVNATTFAVRNYTLTGADSPDPDKNLPIDAPTVVFTDKIPQHGDTLNRAVELRIDQEGVVLERAGARQDMKIQAKDCAQGGLFQMEPEPGTTYVHRLGPGFRYNGPAGTGRLCFTNGRFSGYESPELATRIAPADGQGTTSRWRVSSGGRMGMVVGEDAVEGGCRP